MSQQRGDRIHPEHDLVPMMQRDPFFCSACRQIGFESAYGCKLCLVLVHKECMYPPSTASHPLQKDCNLNYNPQPETSGACNFCTACSEPLRSGTYSSAASRNPSFHPSCLRLEKCINVNGVELNLVPSCSSTCNWCNTSLISRNKVEIPSWWYVSECGKHSFHVGCVRKMMVESWKSGSITCADEDDDDGQSSLRADMPCEREGKRRLSKRKRTTMAVCLVAAMAAAPFDPTIVSSLVAGRLGLELLR